MPWARAGCVGASIADEVTHAGGFAFNSASHCSTCNYEICHAQACKDDSSNAHRKRKGCRRRESPRTSADWAASVPSRAGAAVLAKAWAAARSAMASALQHKARSAGTCTLGCCSMWVSRRASAKAHLAAGAAAPASCATIALADIFTVFRDYLPLACDRVCAQVSCEAVTQHSQTWASRACWSQSARRTRHRAWTASNGATQAITACDPLE